MRGALLRCLMPTVAPVLAATPAHTDPAVCAATAREGNVASCTAALAANPPTSPRASCWRSPISPSTMATTRFASIARSLGLAPDDPDSHFGFALRPSPPSTITMQRPRRCATRRALNPDDRLTLRLAFLIFEKTRTDRDAFAAAVIVEGGEARSKAEMRVGSSSESSLAMDAKRVVAIVDGEIGERQRRVVVGIGGEANITAPARGGAEQQVSAVAAAPGPPPASGETAPPVQTTQNDVAEPIASGPVVTAGQAALKGGCSLRRQLARHFQGECPAPASLTGVLASAIKCAAECDQRTVGPLRPPCPQMLCSP